MSQSFRATLGALIILGGLAAFLFWAVKPTQGEFWIWIGRIISLAVVAIAGGLLIYSKTLKDKAPDLLAKIFPGYFERNGFCFAIIPEIIGGQSKISVYYQNRYERACEAEVSFAPTKVAFKEVSELPKFKIKVACEGGEFGKILCDFGLPLRFKNEAILWDVDATTKYHKGHGKLLRLRDGLRAPARVSIKFPEQMFSSPHLGMWKHEIIWKLNTTNSI
jgi:hypothetical protein